MSASRHGSRNSSQRFGTTTNHYESYVDESDSEMQTLDVSVTTEAESTSENQANEHTLLMPDIDHNLSPKRSTFAQLVTFKNFKVVVLLLLAIIATVMFAIVREEDAAWKNLAALSQDSPKYIPVEMHSELIEIHFSAQALDRHTSIIFHIDVQASNSSDVDIEWTTLLYHNVTLEAHSEVSDLHIFDIGFDTWHTFHRFQIALRTNSEAPIGITFSAVGLYPTARYEVVFAAVILVALYILIVFEIMHRTVAAMLCAFVAISVVAQIHVRPSFDTVVSWIDFDTLGLLFGMMLMVGIFSTTGFFEWAAVRAYKYSKGNLWYLTLILCLFTGLLSAFLDNVTTILLVGPITIKLCKVLDLEPHTMLIAEVLFSNIGGAGTIIGDPPNILIGNNPVIKSKVGFAYFSLHVFPGIVLAAGGLVVYMWFTHRSKLYRDPTTHLKAELAIWKKTRERFKDPAESHVRSYLSDYIRSLKRQIKQQSTKMMTVSELEERYKIHDLRLFINSCIVLTGVVTLFFLHSLVGLELSLAWISVIGAMVHIVVSKITKVEEILEKVELGTLLFFAALFILMKALEELGLIRWIGNQTTNLIALVSPESRLLVAVLLILWVSAIASAFIDNIPYTATLVPVVVQLHLGELQLPLEPLVWALSFGTCLGGNGTLIGASANVVAVGLAEQQGFTISFKDWFKMGFPVMIITTGIAMIYLCVFHVWIPWY